MAEWKTLSVKQDGHDEPVLLAKATFQASSYTVHVTDLTAMWTESLDRKAIIRRALDEDTSIDPSDGADQLQNFLECVRKAIHGEDGTSISISRSPSGDCVTLIVNAQLPAPLKPFHWTMTLKSSPVSAFANEMVVPTLTKLCHTQQVTPSLLAMITEKDHVISKLRDKLEVSGIDLTSIFPGVVTKGSKPLDEAVPGLKQFDHSLWLKSLPDVTTGIPLSELCNEVFGTSRSVGNGQVRSKPVHDPTIVLDSQPPQAMIAEGGEDDFEVMDTVDPGSELRDQKNITSKDKRSASCTASDTESDTLDGDGSLEVKHVKTSNTRDPMPVKKRIGTIGKKSKVSTTHADGNNTQAEALDDQTKPETPEFSAQATPQKHKSKIGRIGGKRTATTAENHRTSPLKDNLPSRGVDTADEDRGRQITPTRDSDGPRETSQERADRIRAELKNELEEKKKAPPKKKRRF